MKLKDKIKQSIREGDWETRGQKTGRDKYATMDPETYKDLENYIDDKTDVNIVKGDVSEELGEEGNPMDTMYVEYVKEYSDETPFEWKGNKYVYCWGRYPKNEQFPDGKVDIAVYSYSNDLAFGYKWFRTNVLGIVEESINPKMTKDQLVETILSVDDKVIKRLKVKDILKK